MTSEQCGRSLVAEDPVPPEIHETRGQILSEEICNAVLAQRPAFLSRRRADIVKMRDALTARNFALIESIGHNCKGIGTGYGFPEISSLGFAIESAAKAWDEKPLVECVARLERYIHAASGGEPV